MVTLSVRATNVLPFSTLERYKTKVRLGKSACGAEEPEVTQESNSSLRVTPLFGTDGLVPTGRRGQPISHVSARRQKLAPTWLPPHIETNWFDKQVAIFQEDLHLLGKLWPEGQ